MRPADRPEGGAESRLPNAADTPVSIPPDRREWRRQLLAARLALPAEEVARRSALICQHLQTLLPSLLQRPLTGLRIAFCWPIQNEPDLRPAIAAWQAAGAQGCLPVVIAPGTPLAFRDWQDGDALEPDGYGIPTPASGPLVTPDVMLLPCNAFDNAGFRLGYGGGFFDRTLAVLQPSPLAIGVAYEESRVATINPGEYDLPLAAMVTEAGSWLSRRGA